MTLRLLPVLLLLSCSGTVAAPQSLRVVTWNVHNLLEPEGERIARTASVLSRLDADVAVLEEVSASSVAALATSGTTGVTVPGNDPRGIQIAVLTRLDVSRVVSHRDDVFEGYRYARDCLEVHLSSGPFTIAVLGVHFKSKAAPDDPAKRLAEARHTRAIADSIAEDAVVVAGDMNDVPGSPALEAFGGYDDVASALDSPYTTEYRGHPELIDHAMVSPWLAARLDPESVTIDHGQAAHLTSDHAPLAATFRTP
jgi:endonuclease/exonuclease/phosphatase family metal-dependent hydrolase